VYLSAINLAREKIPKMLTLIIISGEANLPLHFILSKDVAQRILIKFNTETTITPIPQTVTYASVEKGDASSSSCHLSWQKGAKCS